MSVNPIIPIWLMAIICVGLLLLKRKGWVAYIRQIVIVLLLFTINLRVMLPDDEKVVKTPTINAYVLFVIDDTISMVADDMPDDKTRLEAVAEDCDYIIDNLNGAHFGVVTFNNMAQILTPYTNNPDHVKSMIKTISPLREKYAQGSSFNLCQGLIADQIKVARDKEDTNVYVFFFSDGENNKDDKIKSYGEVGNNIDGGAVLGYGTKAGGKMDLKVTSKYGVETVRIKDSNGKDAISCIDEDNLKKIAGEMNVDYIKVKEPADLDKTINGILDNVKMTEEERTEVGKIETYYFFIPPLAALLLWDFFHFKRKV